MSRQGSSLLREAVMDAKVETSTEKKARSRGSKLAARDDLVCRSDHFRVLFDGDLDRLRAVFSKWRCMLQSMERLTGLCEQAVADFTMKRKVVTEEKVVGKDGTVKTRKVVTWEPGSHVLVKMSVDDAKQAATAIVGKDVNVGEKRYYEWFRRWQEIDEQLGPENMGPPRFDRRMFEQAIKAMSAIRDKRMPSHGNISRSKMVVGAAMEPPRYDRVPLEFIHAPESNASRVRLVREGEVRKVVLMLNEHDPGAALTFIVRGAIVASNGKTYHAGSPDSDYRFDRFFDGRWIPVNPRVNVDDEGHCHLYISNYRPRREETGLIDDNVLEVTFHRIDGGEIRRPWRPAREQDRLVGRVFLIHTRVMRGGKPSWPANVAINDMIAAMRGYDKRIAEKQECRNTRRYGPPRLRRPFQKIIDAIVLAKERTQRQANHRWVNEVLFQARKGRCKTIKLFGVPDGAKEGLLLDRSSRWPWSEWTRILGYKAKEAGFVVEAVTTKEDIDAMRAAIHHELTREKTKGEVEVEDVAVAGSAPAVPVVA